MKAAKTIAGLLTLFIAMPIWYYLIYQLLARSNATELMWFLYWIYLPVGMFAAILSKIVEANE